MTIPTRLPNVIFKFENDFECDCEDDCRCLFVTESSNVVVFRILWGATTSPAVDRQNSVTEQNREGFIPEIERYRFLTLLA